MKRDELKTGMILVYSNGDKAMVLRGTINGDIISGDIWMPMNEMAINLEDEKKRNKYIVKVVQPIFNKYHNASFDVNDTANYKVVWERQHTIEIDGKKIPLSEESYQKLKESLL